MNLPQNDVLPVALVCQSKATIVCKRHIERLPTAWRVANPKRSIIRFIEMMVLAGARTIAVEMIQVQPRRTVVNCVNRLAATCFSQRRRVQCEIVIDELAKVSHGCG